MMNVNDVCIKSESINEFQPLVSIVIPVYNGSNYMKEAIDSALAQTYERVEIIVVNDGSNDGGKTERIALSYDDKIHYIKKENGGVASALNAGIHAMHGEYFSWLSHDDLYTQDKIAVQINALRNISEKNAIILCGHTYMDKDSQLIKKRGKNRRFPANELLSWKQALHSLLKAGSFNGCALLIPRTAFDTCGEFDERLRFNQDGFMWDKLFIEGFPLCYVPTTCVINRIHGGQLTQLRQDTFHADCEVMSTYLIPVISSLTTTTERFLSDYTQYNAKHGNWRILNDIFKLPLEKLSLKERIYAGVLCCYGFVRPIIRKVYYVLQKL